MLLSSIIFNIVVYFAWTHCNLSFKCAVNVLFNSVICPTELDLFVHSLKMATHVSQNILE